MAKRSKKPKNYVATDYNRVSDRSFWYTDLAFVPEDWKESRLWMAQSLFFAKLNGVRFLDQQRCWDYRKLSNLQLDEGVYKRMVDPITPMGGGGTAAYFAADWKANPIDIHLDNIVRAKLDKTAQENRIQVNEIDKFAKSQRQAAKDEIIYQREFRNLINDCNKMIDLPPIKESEDPKEYVAKLQGKSTGQKVDDISRLIQTIKTKVVEKKDWELYDRYVYKGDIERAFEMAVEHYLINQNKWRNVNELFIDDLKNFNKACGRWYIDETTGRGNVDYLSPDILFINQFYRKDGEDIIYYFFEKDIIFADFVRMFGTTLTDEELREVFEINKTSGAVHGLSWQGTGVDYAQRRNTAFIRIGYYSVMTQETTRFAEKFVQNSIPTWERKPLSWKPDKESATQKQRIYNVWYSCYYVPPPGQRVTANSQADWAWQSKYIFNIKKNIDMYRYGVDLRYAKPDLVIWKDERPSFMDIKQAFMPKIHNLWHKFQNSIIQDVSTMALDSDLLTGLLNAVDETNKNNLNDPSRPSGNNGVDAGMEAWRALKQGTITFLKFRDKNGNLVVDDPSRLFVPIDNKQLDKAERYLQTILELYNMMTMALAQSDIAQGQSPKPRTAVAGIEASLEAANNGIWFIEKPVREFFIMYAERCVQHVLSMIKEKKRYNYEDRWNEFAEVVGLAQALMVEGIEDLDPEDIGITVSLEDTAAMREYIFNLANQMANNHEVSREGVGLVIDTLHSGSWKYAYALLMLSANEMKREQQAQQEMEFEQQKQLQTQQMQIAQTLLQAKTQGKQQEIQTQGEVDSQVDIQLNEAKYRTQAALKEQMKQNKLEEKQKDADIEMQKQMARNTIPV